jgi:hypothetical protein
VRLVNENTNIYQNSEGSQKLRSILGPIHPPTRWVGRGRGVLSPWVEREADHSPPSSAKVKNAYSYTSTPPYDFMTWCLVKHRDNFTLPLTVRISWRLTVTRLYKNHIWTHNVTYELITTGCMVKRQSKNKPVVSEFWASRQIYTEVYNVFYKKNTVLYYTATKHKHHYSYTIHIQTCTYRALINVLNEFKNVLRDI